MWPREICVHGIVEDLDWHDCEKCQEIAKAAGLKVIPRSETYIVTRSNLKVWQKKLSPKGYKLDEMFKLIHKPKKKNIVSKTVSRFSKKKH